MAQLDAIRPDELGTTSAWSEEQRAVIQAESQFILSHSSFKSSKRCVALFQYLIDRALEGDVEGVKERTLGVEVFGRAPGYDTNLDPIVRMSANEIRKRLALCYQDEERAHRVRIQLLPGSYIPHFEITPEQDAALIPQIEVLAPLQPVDGQSTVRLDESNPDNSVRNTNRRWLLGVALAACALAAGLIGWRVLAPHFRSTQDYIWAPLVSSNQALTISVGDSYFGGAIVAPPDNGWAIRVAKIIATRQLDPITPPVGTLSPPLLPIVDSKVLARVSGTLASHHRTAEIRGSSGTTLEDLRHGPDVIIGVFDNPWFLILLSNLRYHVGVDPVTQDEWIADAKNPDNRDWKTNGKLVYADSEPDYALISRVQSPETGNWILALGGIGTHGTEAAGDLLTDPKYASLLPASLRTEKKNLQIVVKTTVINGNVGPPQIIAVYTW